MENNLKFNSAICTSRVQSERLLELGLKKETADCYWFYCDIAKEWKCTILSSTQVFKDYPTTVIPAWSLHRLIEMVAHTQYPYYVISKELPIYDALCERIEWLIKEGYFNKEYLV